LLGRHDIFCDTESFDWKKYKFGDMKALLQVLNRKAIISLKIPGLSYIITAKILLSPEPAYEKVKLVYSQDQFYNV